MKNKIIFLFLLLTCGCASSLKKPFLWSIEKEGRTSYLFGTIHSGVSSDELPKEVIEKVRNANGFFNEVPIDAIAGGKLSDIPEDFENYFKSLMARASDEPTLDKVLSPAAWNFIVSKYSQKYGSAELFKETTPFFALTLVHADPDYTVWVTSYQAYDYQWYNSIDYKLETVARKSAIPAKSLDTIPLLSATRKFQIEDARILLESYMNGKKVGSEIETEDELAAAYRAADENKIKKALRTASLEEQEVLLSARNRHWVETLLVQDRSLGGGMFVAVGVGHMLGDKDNLLQLFEKQGYVVKRVSK